MQLRAARRPYNSRTRHSYILAETMTIRQLLQRLGECDVGEGAVGELNFAVAGVEVGVLVVH